VTAWLRVLDAGILATVQDRGRYGYQRYGVPVSGALDPVSFGLANAAVGNGPDEAAIELLAGGATFAVEGRSARVAAGGIGASLEIADGGTTRGFPAFRSVTVRQGGTITVPRPSCASCCYLAIEGGIDVAPVLQSRSTYLRGGFGGFEGRALRPGDRLPLMRTAADRRHERALDRPIAPDPSAPIRVVLGPQAEMMTDAAIETFLSSSFAVGRDSDRMGMRLDGPRLAHRGGFDIASDGIATGAIQVPGDGRPILLLADRHTAGGYPKIAAVVSADIARVARKRPGDRLRFRAVSVAEAEDARRQAEKALADLVAAIAPVPEDGLVNLSALYAANIVSGIHHEPD